MPDHNRHAVCVSRGRDFVRQPRLADSRFAGDQEQAPAPRSRVVESTQQRSQLALAAHHRTRRPSSKLVGSTYLRRVNLRDESIAPGRHGNHESWRLGIVAQSLPDLSDRSVDAVLAIDKDALAPDALEDLLARNQLSAALNQQ